MFFIGVVIDAIKKDIDLYKKGKYNPYVFRLKKDEEDLSFWKRFGIMLFVIVGLISFSQMTKNTLYLGCFLQPYQC